MPVVDGLPPQERRHRVYWWKEALLMVAFYLLYSWIRNRFGSNALDEGGVPVHAFDNAIRVIRFEQFLGLFHEQAIQQLFLPYRGVHPVLEHVLRHGPLRRHAGRLRPAVLEAAGRVPRVAQQPRDHDRPGDRRLRAVPADAAPAARQAVRPLRRGLHPERRPAARAAFGFTDTLSEYGGPWSFDSDEMASISNQYAAMPSMHIGWSTWCAVAVWPLLRRRWQRAVVFLYPLATLFCIIVTANHYWIDGVGGLFCFAVGTLCGWGLHRWNQNRLDRKFMAELGATPRAVQTPVR